MDVLMRGKRGLVLLAIVFVAGACVSVLGLGDVESAGAAATALCGKLQMLCVDGGVDLDGGVDACVEDLSGPLESPSISFGNLGDCFAKTTCGGLEECLDAAVQSTE